MHSEVHFVHTEVNKVQGIAFENAHHGLPMQWIVWQSKRVVYVSATITLSGQFALNPTPVLKLKTYDA